MEEVRGTRTRGFIVWQGLALLSWHDHGTSGVQNTWRLADDSLYAGNSKSSTYIFTSQLFRTRVTCRCVLIQKVACAESEELQFR